MGERGNIVFLFEAPNEGSPSPRVYFYTHWRGHKLAEILREAMNHKETWGEGFGNLTGTTREACRWDDASYFARVVFCKLVEGDEKGVLSFGIDTSRTWPNYDELHVDVKAREIRQVQVDAFDRPNQVSVVAEVCVRRWTFEQFAAGEPGSEGPMMSFLGVRP